MAGMAVARRIGVGDHGGRCAIDVIVRGRRRLRRLPRLRRVRRGRATMTPFYSSQEVN